MSSTSNLAASERIKEIQARVGAAPDGRWGKKSQAALVAHMDRILEKHNFFGIPDTNKEVIERYGHPNDANFAKTFLTNIDVSSLENLYYLGKTKVTKIRCHVYIRKNLLGFLSELNSHPTHKLLLREYAGCYNHRNSRMGNVLSDHAWGIAIDLAPKRNKLRAHWPLEAEMPLEVYEIAAKYGATSLGWQANYDAMHIT